MFCCITFNSIYKDHWSHHSPRKKLSTKNLKKQNIKLWMRLIPMAQTTEIQYLAGWTRCTFWYWAQRHNVRWSCWRYICLSAERNRSVLFVQAKSWWWKVDQRLGSLGWHCNPLKYLQCSSAQILTSSTQTQELVGKVIWCQYFSSLSSTETHPQKWKQGPEL